MEYLDLAIHSIDEAEGKMISLNGADYIFRALLAEGGQGFVFPIANSKNGLPYYAAKLHKFKPGSAEFMEIKGRLQSVFKALNLGDILQKIERGRKMEGLVRSEVYEACGGLFEIMPFLAPEGGERFFKTYYRDEMSKASNFQQSAQFTKAILQYKGILEKNPGHTYALLNLASLYIQQSDQGTAFDLMENALKIEPNLVENYHFVADMYATSGHPEKAIGTLQKTIDRYPADAYSIHLQNRIALHASRWDIIEKNRELLNKEFGDNTRLAALQDFYRKNYLPNPPLISVAQLLEDPEAIINTYIQKYTDGVYRETIHQMSHLLTNMHEIKNKPRLFMINTCVILIILCSFPMEDYDSGIYYILKLVSIYDDAADLPGIPSALQGDMVIEEINVTRIISIIEFFISICSPEHKESLKKALTMYNEYQLMLNPSS